MPAAQVDPTIRRIKKRLADLVGEPGSGGARDLATATGESEVNVHRYVRGTVVPPHDFLVKVADYYEESLDSLYGRGPGARKEAAAPKWARRMNARLRRVERMVGELPDKAYANKVGSDAAEQVIDALRGDDGLEKWTRDLTNSILEAVQKPPQQKSVSPSRGKRRRVTGIRQG